MENLTTKELFAIYDIVSNVNYKKDIIKIYKTRCVNQIDEWFKNINSQKLEVTTRNDGKLTISTFKDMYNILYAHIEVMRKHLCETEHIQEIIELCLVILQKEQNNYIDNIMTYEIEVLCANINTNISDEIEHQLNDLITDSLVKDLYHSVIKKFTELRKETIIYLAKNICKDFNFDLTDGDEKYNVSIIIATLDDYFTDLIKWLIPEYFNILVIEINELVQNEYKSNDSLENFFKEYMK